MTSPLKPFVVAGFACILWASSLSTALAKSASCNESANAVGDFVAVVVDCQKPGSSVPGGVGAVSVVQETVFVEYRWASVCTDPLDGTEAGIITDCQAARVCTDPRERLYRLWGRTENPSTWRPLGTQCFGRAPTPADAPKPRITPALVLNEIRRIGLPTLEAKTQPENKTLVNFATIFYTEPEPFTRTVQLLGQSVDIEATPARFTWHHGDGSTTTTTSPGAPYPSKEITYNYTDAHTTVSPRVDVTYAARFRVNSGPWRDIAATVTIAGPAGRLRISEAVAVLSGSYE